jgi:hypothetical protein
LKAGLQARFFYGAGFSSGRDWAKKGFPPCGFCVISDGKEYLFMSTFTEKITLKNIRLLKAE